MFITAVCVIFLIKSIIPESLRALTRWPKSPRTLGTRLTEYEFDFYTKTRNQGTSSSEEERGQWKRACKIVYF